jgi:hypothetical protein
MAKSHFDSSWQDQGNRIGRWHKRVTAIGRGIPVGMSNDEALDDVFAFISLKLRSTSTSARTKTLRCVETSALGSSTSGLSRPAPTSTPRGPQPP